MSVDSRAQLQDAVKEFGRLVQSCLQEMAPDHNSHSQHNWRKPSRDNFFSKNSMTQPKNSRPQITSVFR